MATTVAVTGATGFTGGALARRLAGEGYVVKALARRAKDVVQEPSAPLQVVEGDLSDGQTLARLVEGVDTVFHIAAMYRDEGAYEDFLRVNYQGTVDLLDAARKARVRRFVYCSTIGVHGTVAHSPAGEDAPFDPRDPYQETKLKAEEFCRASMAAGDIEIVIIRPCGIYGPGDTRMLKMFRMISRGRFFFVGSYEPNFHPVYIDDLVSGFVLAMTVPQAAGQTFIIGSARYLPLTEYVATAAKVLGVRRPWVRVPYGPMRIVARVCEIVFPMIGRQPPLHRRRLTFFKHNRAFSIDRARRILGYDPKVDLEEGFKRTVSWYRTKGLLG